MTREEIKRIALEVGFDDGEINTCQLMLENFAVLVASAERSACAKICEEHSTWTGRMCAETIKARR